MKTIYRIVWLVSIILFCAFWLLASASELSKIAMLIMSPIILVVGVGVTINSGVKRLNIYTSLHVIAILLCLSASLLMYFAQGEQNVVGIAFLWIGVGAGYIVMLFATLTWIGAKSIYYQCKYKIKLFKIKNNLIK